MGYYDPIAGKYVVPHFLDALLTAVAYPDVAVFVCLDEMNLAKVEYYFSDFLSAMETGTPIQIHSSSTSVEGTNGSKVPPFVPYPNNFFVVGTINVDESVNPISDKVYDRAVLIDMTAVDFNGFFNSLRERFPDHAGSVGACEVLLSTVSIVLNPAGLGFGYRVAEEFIRYHHFATRIGAADDVLQTLMLQKLLVKLRGTERERPVLIALQAALNDYPRVQELLRSLLTQLDDSGSFQVIR